jgi:hypothetical protein
MNVCELWLQQNSCPSSGRTDGRSGRREDSSPGVDTPAFLQIRRYDAVIHLRTPQIENYNHQNPARIESAEDAVMIHKKIEQAWHTHPRRFIVEGSPDFLKKAVRALEILRSELPECCRSHVTPMFLEANHTSIRR